MARDKLVTYYINYLKIIINNEKQIRNKKTIIIAKYINLLLQRLDDHYNGYYSYND